MSTKINASPRLLFAAMAMIAAAVFHQGCGIVDRTKNEFEQGGMQKSGEDTSLLRVGIVNNLQCGLAKAPGCGFQLALRAIGQLLVGHGVDSMRSRISRLNVSQCVDAS